MKWFMSDMKNCTSCPLCKSRTRVVFGYGAKDPLFILVGEAPGRDEDIQGKPFVGRCGKLLDKMLKKYLGITRDKIFITNANLCRPLGNRKPTGIEMRICRSRLEYTLSYFNCPIVTAGAHATEAVTGFRGLRGLRGEVLDWRDRKKRKRAVLPIYHPSYILRTGDLKAAEEDWKKVEDAIRRSLE